MRKGTRHKHNQEPRKEEVKDQQLSDAELPASRMSPAELLESRVQEIRQEIELGALKQVEGNHEVVVLRTLKRLAALNLSKLGASIVELAETLIHDGVLPAYGRLALESEQKASPGKGIDGQKLERVTKLAEALIDDNVAPVSSTTPRENKKQVVLGSTFSERELAEIVGALREKPSIEVDGLKEEECYHKLSLAIVSTGLGSEHVVPMLLEFGQQYRAKHLKRIVSLRTEAARAVMQLHQTKELGLLPKSAPTQDRNLKDFATQIEGLFSAPSGIVFSQESLSAFKTAGEFLSAFGAYLGTPGLAAEVPIQLSERQKAKKNARADAAEQEYRSSDEARVLRLCREISEGPKSGPAAQKTAKQLTKLSTKACVSILSHFSARIENFEEIQQAFIAALDEARQNNAIQVERSSPAPQQDEEQATEALSEPTQEELQEIRRQQEERVTELLLECGVEDDAVLQECLAHPDLAQISLDLAVVKAYTPLDIRVRGLLIETNRAILTGGLGISLQSYLKQVQKTLELSSQLPGYEDAFDLTSHPEHYAFPILLDRTASAAKKLHEMLSVVRRERNARHESAARAEPGEKRMPEAEEALVERLRRYVDKPYVAYAVIRLSFLQSGGYNTGAVGRNLRDRRLQSAFNSVPVAQDVRECERQLIKAGFLKDDPRSTKAQGNLMLCPLREVEDSGVRELILALTDEDTVPKGQIPKLPFE